MFCCCYLRALVGAREAGGLLLAGAGGELEAPEVEVVDTAVALQLEVYLAGRAGAGVAPPGAGVGTTCTNIHNHAFNIYVEKYRYGQKTFLTSFLSNLLERLGNRGWHFFTQRMKSL